MQLRVGVATGIRGRKLRKGQVKWMRVLPAKVDDPTSVPLTYMVEGEDQLLASCPVTSANVYAQADSQISECEREEKERKRRESNNGPNQEVGRKGRKEKFQDIYRRSDGCA